MDGGRGQQGESVFVGERGGDGAPSMLNGCFCGEPFAFCWLYEISGLGSDLLSKRPPVGWIKRPTPKSGVKRSLGTGAEHTPPEEVSGRRGAATKGGQQPPKNGNEAEARSFRRCKREGGVDRWDPLK